MNCNAIDDRSYDLNGNLITEKEKSEEKDEPDYSM